MTTPELDISAFDQMFASNVRAPFLLVAAFAPAMAARGHGSIVNMSSMAGGVGLVGGAAYGATNAIARDRSTPQHLRARSSSPHSANHPDAARRTTGGD